MIYIQKKSEPPKLMHYRKTTEAGFDYMDSEVKEELRISLLEEQGYICAYCMSRIHDSTDVKIEHLEARNKANELIYQNLLAVCKGNEGQPWVLQTCDTRKGSQSITISPLDKNAMETIYYKNNGEIHSTDEEMEQDIDKTPYTGIIQWYIHKKLKR